MHHVSSSRTLPYLRIPAVYGSSIFQHGRHYARSTSGQIRHPDFEATIQPVKVTEDGYKSLRSRQYGNKSLPLPPLMDPIAIAAKTKYTEPKRKPTRRLESLPDMQKKLALNPHAHALASPIRQCMFTKARLPSHFLIPFTSEVQLVDQASQRPKIYAELVAHAGSRAYRSTASYLTNSRKVFDQLNGKGNWVVLLSERMKVAYCQKAGKSMGSLKLKDSWKWNNEMADMVLTQLREDVLESLRALLDQQDLMLIWAHSPDKAGSNDEVVCLLELSEHAGQEAMSPPGQPTFSLKELLSPKQLDTLSSDEDYGLQGADLLAVRRDKKTVKLQLALSKLDIFAKGN